MTDVKNEAPLIQLTDAIVRRDGKNILEVDSFVLHSGENIALLGPNGAGKIYVHSPYHARRFSALSRQPSHALPRE